MKKIISIIALAATTAFGATAQKVSNTQNTIVIIPGAWSSAADWGYVTPALKAAGNDVIVVNLPDMEMTKPLLPTLL